MFGQKVDISGDLAIACAVSSPAPTSCGSSSYLFARNAGGPGAWGEVAKLVGGGRDVGVSGDVAITSHLSLSEQLVYVYTRDQGGPDHWGQTAVLSAPGADRYGSAIAVDGDIIVVGAWADDSFAPSAGAAYVYERDLGGSDGWGLRKVLSPSDAGTGDQFGYDVSISGDLIAVGALREGSPGSGSAYIFGRHVGGPEAWGEIATVTGSGAGEDTQFGQAVDIDASTLVVGSREEPLGAAYVFERDRGGPGVWGESARLIPPTPSNTTSFGQAVAVSGDRALVGAVDVDRINGAGSTYVFGRNVGGAQNWGELAWLTASDATRFHDFGVSVGLDGETAIVGASRSGSLSTPGRAYVFTDGLTCEAGPAACTTWEKGSLLVKETTPGKESIKMSLFKGPALSQNDLGEPVTEGGTAYTACVYDDEASLVGQIKVDRAGGSCRQRPCWIPLGGAAPDGEGYRYSDANRSSAGVTRLILRSGAKPKATLKASNNAAKFAPRLPTGWAATLAGSASVLVQLHRDDSGECFSVTYDQVGKDTGTLFKAKAK